MSQNHVIDPGYFYDAIEMFAFNYTWFVQTGETVDDYGRIVTSFATQTVRGSLQPQETSLKQNVTGNTTELTYAFYCKSLYRINIGDFILYKDRYLHVDGVHDYDEWGVRSCTLTMVNLNDHKNFQEYLNYLNGTELV